MVSNRISGDDDFDSLVKGMWAYWTIHSIIVKKLRIPSLERLFGGEGGITNFAF